MVYFMPMKHNHAEAFAVIRYASQAGSATAKLGHYRDGETAVTTMPEDHRGEVPRG